MKSKKILSMALCAAMLLALVPGALAAEAPEPQLPQGASFEEIQNITIDTSGKVELPTADSFYLYSPSNPHTYDLLSSFLNGVIFVYPDKPYATKEEALASITDLGLIDIAESCPAYILIAKPLNGETWTEADVGLYWTYTYYLSGGYFAIDQGIGTNPMETQFHRVTMQTLQYVAAEGSGATFVNNHLSQEASRIAGVALFGGEIAADTRPGYAIPAYLVDADTDVVTFYQGINGTDTKDGNHFWNSAYPQKQVFTCEGSASFDKDCLKTAWTNLLSRTTRLCISENLVLRSCEMGDWMLMTWPNLAEIGLNLKSFEYNRAAGSFTAYDAFKTKSADTVHVFVPQAVLDDPETPVPVVFVLHGMMDDPINVVLGCGWADKAVEENFIIISPSTEDADYLLELLDFVKSGYPVDPTRVYVTGFSMGGANTGIAGLTYPNVFAAMAPMGSTGSYVKDMDAVGYDLPIIDVVGSIDYSSNVTKNGDGLGHDVVTGLPNQEGSALEGFFHMNEMAFGEPDYEAYPYWGFASDKFEVITDKDHEWWIQSYNKAGYEAPFIQLVTLQGAGHANADYMATVAWDFMSKFSRAADGACVEGPVPFVDVSPSDWFYAPVCGAADMGLVLGTDVKGKLFSPETDMTANQYLTILYRLAASMSDLIPADKATSGENWSEGAQLLAQLLQLELTDYDSSMTRGEMAYITNTALVAAQKLTGVALDAAEPVDFTDIEDSIYAAHIQALQAVGGVRGYEEADGTVTFRPDNTIRRCEVSQILMNLVGRLGA